MNIAVDGRLLKQHFGGMSILVDNLLKEFKKTSPSNTYTIFANDISLNGKNIYQKFLAVFKDHLWTQISLGKKLNGQYDWVYFPNPPVSYLTNIKIVLTIPDMSFFFDQSLNSLTKFYLYFIYLLSAHKAQVIATFSENSKKDIVKLLRVRNSKVHVIPLAISSNFKPQHKTEINKVLKNYQISYPYILFVAGNFVPRKNTFDLLVAFKKILKENPKITLVLVGNNADNYFKEVHKQTVNLKIERNTIFTGKVSEDSLIKLYSGAEIFAYPSLYEGFGLPPLEAMACGTPTIVYNNSSLPEVVDDAAIIVDNKEQLAKAVKKLLADKKLAQELTRKGYQRVKDFSWKHTANEYLNLLKEYGSN